MPETHPRRGSMQFWPRKRARCSLARVRTWANENKVKPLGFIGYKAGMTHLSIVDNRPKALTKGDDIVIASTIVECPPMIMAGAAFYKNSPEGSRKIGSFLAPNLGKEIAKNFALPKKSQKTVDDFSACDDLKILVHSNPKLLTFGTKKPKFIEVALGGSKEEKLAYVKNNLGKEITINDVFEKGNIIDIHGITKGKGFQGTVKRFGVPIRQHKAEKTKRGIATLGPWHPKRIAYTVPQSGKMGYHLRTEYNKQIVKIGSEEKEINPSGGIKNYGLIKNNYVLIRGSLPGSRKRAILLTQPIRVNKTFVREAPEINYIHK